MEPEALRGRSPPITTEPGGAQPPALLRRPLEATRAVAWASGWGAQLPCPNQDTTKTQSQPQNRSYSVH